MKLHLCSLNWSRWSAPFYTLDHGFKQQWRCCTVCNKALFRSLGWDKHVSLEDVIAALSSIKEPT